MSVEGKRVLVTGATGGLGRAVKAELERRGARVVGIDKNVADNDRGVIEADVRDPAAVEAAVDEAVRSLGGLDILVNNAGVLALEDPGRPPGDSVSELLDVNFLGAWRVTAAALPALLESRGRVVNVASMFAAVNAPFIPAYAASKRALAAYADILRFQYRKQLRVVTVYPGYMNTPIHDGAVRQGLSVAKVVTFKLGDRTVLTLEESIPKAARRVVSACSGGGRDRALSARGALSLAFARHTPSLVDWFVGWRLGRLARGGMTVHLDERADSYTDPIPTA